MKKIDFKKLASGFVAWAKERVRKLIVALKRSPQVIPLASLAVTVVLYTFNITDISSTTGKIQGANMGLSAFVTLLFMILSFVCLLNAYPKRQKPNIFMLILMVVLYAGVIASDVIYLGCINAAIYREINPIEITQSTMYILRAYYVVNTNIICIAITAALALLEPLYAKLIRKINTSIEVEDGTHIDAIDMSEE